MSVWKISFSSISWKSVVLDLVFSGQIWEHALKMYSEELQYFTNDLICVCVHIYAWNIVGIKRLDLTMFPSQH